MLYLIDHMRLHPSATVAGNLSEAWNKGSLINLLNARLNCIRNKPFMNCINESSSTWITDLAMSLFDYTPNRFAQEKLRQFLKQPASSITEITTKQNILKGFIDNKFIADAAYGKSDLYSVIDFLATLRKEAITSKEKWAIRLNINRKMKLQGALIQTSLLLNAIYKAYFKNLSLKEFPRAYRTELIWCADFLNKINAMSILVIDRPEYVGEINFLKSDIDMHILQQPGTGHSCIGSDYPLF